MKCRNCNADIEPGTMFCPECGSRQDEVSLHVSYCPSCGYKIDEDIAFCPECGENLRMQEAPEESETYTNSYGYEEGDLNEFDDQFSEKREKPRKSGGTIIAVVLAFVVLAAIIAAGVFYVYPTFFVKDQSDETAIGQETGGTDVDIEDVDVDGTKKDASLKGTLEKDGDNWKLSLDAPISISVKDNDGEITVIRDVKEANLNISKLKDGVIDQVDEGDIVSAVGDISVKKETVSITADVLKDRGGKEIKSTEEISKETEETKTNTKITGDYVIADSNSKVLTDADVSGLSIQQLNYAKNEIYARHGRKFDSPELQNYFNSKNWYQGTVNPGDFNEGLLSDTEKQNAEFLSAKEYAIDPAGYHLDAN